LAIEANKQGIDDGIEVNVIECHKLIMSVVNMPIVRLLSAAGAECLNLFGKI